MRIAALIVITCMAAMSSYGAAGGQSYGDLSLRGKVVDANGHPVAGAFVYLNAVVTRTDVAGKYSAAIPPASQIVASCWALGRQQIIQVVRSGTSNSLSGLVNVSFDGSYALPNALHNAAFGATLTHAPLRSASWSRYGRFVGSARVPLAPHIYVTLPNGLVRLYPLRISADDFQGRIPFHSVGAYTVGIYARTGLPIFELQIFHGVTPFAPPPPDFTPDRSNASSSQLAVTAIGLVDQARHQEGLPPVNMQKTIAAVATAHTSEMVRQGYVHLHPHSGADGSTPYQRVRRGGFRTKAVGEAIGGGFTVRLALANILASPWHRRIILGRYRYVGIGFARSGPETYMTVDLAK